MKVEIIPGVGTYYIMVDGREVERHGELARAEQRVAELLGVAGGRVAQPQASSAQEILKGNTGSVLKVIGETEDMDLLGRLYNAESEGASRKTVLDALYKRGNELDRLTSSPADEGGEPVGGPSGEE